MIIPNFYIWKKIVAAFWFVKLFYVTFMTIRFGAMKFQFYVSLCVAVTVFPILCMFISKVIRDFLEVIDENLELIETIKYILEVFPEAVLIRSCHNSSKK